MLLNKQPPFALISQHRVRVALLRVPVNSLSWWQIVIKNKNYARECNNRYFKKWISVKNATTRRETRTPDTMVGRQHGTNQANHNNQLSSPFGKFCMHIYVADLCCTTNISIRISQHLLIFKYNLFLFNMTFHEIHHSLTSSIVSCLGLNPVLSCERVI